MSGRPPLALADAIARPWKSVRLAASTSFTADEVSALRSLLAKLRSGGDVRILARSKAIANVARKTETMAATLERQRERRFAKAGAL